MNVAVPLGPGTPGLEGTSSIVTSIFLSPFANEPFEGPKGPQTIPEPCSAGRGSVASCFLLSFPSENTPSPAWLFKLSVVLDGGFAVRKICFYGISLRSQDCKLHVI